MRILCLLFPGLAIDLALRGRPAAAGRPVVLLQGHGEDALVAGASAAAGVRGVLSGMSAGQARAACPGALFLADNAGACLEELERIAAIIRGRATPFVAIGGRDHLFAAINGLPVGEVGVAARLAGLAGAWLGSTVRAAVADTRSEALEGARAARRAPLILPGSGDVESLPAFPAGPLTAHARLSVGSSELILAARAEALCARLDALLEAQGGSFREVALRLEGEHTAEVVLRPRGPAQAVTPLVGELLGRLPDGASKAATAVQVELRRLGPAVQVRPLPTFGGRRELARAS